MDIFQDEIKKKSVGTTVVKEKLDKYKGFHHALCAVYNWKINNRKMFKKVADLVRELYRNK